MKQLPRQKLLLEVMLCIFLCSCSLVKLGGTVSRKAGEDMEDYGAQNDGFMGKIVGLSGKISTSVGTAVENAAGGDEPENLKEMKTEQLDERKTIIEVQKRLKMLGYNPGPADGIIGDKTRTAIGEYQQSNGLRVTNSIDKETLSSLEVSAAVEGTAGRDEPENYKETKTVKSDETKTTSLVKKGGTVTRKVGEEMEDYGEQNEGFMGEMIGLSGKVYTSVGTAVEDAEEEDKPKNLKETKTEQSSDSIHTTATKSVDTDQNKSAIAPTSGKAKISSAGPVKVRAQMSRLSKVIEELPPGAEVRILEKSGSWDKIKTSHDIGFVPANTLEIGEN